MKQFLFEPTSPSRRLPRQPDSLQQHNRSNDNKVHIHVYTQNQIRFTLKVTTTACTHFVSVDDINFSETGNSMYLWRCKTREIYSKSVTIVAYIAVPRVGGGDSINS